MLHTFHNNRAVQDTIVMCVKTWSWGSIPTSETWCRNTLERSLHNLEWGSTQSGHGRCARIIIGLSKLSWSQWEMRPPKSSVSLQKHWPRTKVYHLFMNSAASAAHHCRQVISFQQLDRSKTALPVLSSDRNLCRRRSRAYRGEGKHPMELNYLSARMTAFCFSLIGSRTTERLSK